MWLTDNFTPRGGGWNTQTWCEARVMKPNYFGDRLTLKNDKKSSAQNNDTQRQTSRPGRTAVGSGRQRMITWSNPGARRTYGHGDRHLRGSVDVANHAGKDLLTGRPDLHTFKNQLTHSFVQRPDCELVTPTARLLWSCALWVLLILEEVFPQDFFFLPTPIKCVFVDDAVQQHQIIKLSSRL